jgi:dihydrofolate reductase
MGEIHVHEFISLDGVIDTPSWTAAYPWDPKMADRIGAVTGRASGILLGRNTFEMFAPVWSTRTAEDDEGAPFFNDTQKYVVSSTLADVGSWRNSVLIGGYDPEVIRRLKDDVGDLYVSGSGTLVRAMLTDGLVDALHLCVFPHTRGRGPRLFPDGEPRDLERIMAEVYDNGVLYSAYRPEH